MTTAIEIHLSTPAARVGCGNGLRANLMENA